MLLLLISQETPFGDTKVVEVTSVPNELLVKDLVVLNPLPLR